MLQVLSALASHFQCFLFLNPAAWSPEVNLINRDLLWSTGAALDGLTSFLRLAGDTDLGLMLIKLNDLLTVNRLLVNTVTLWL